MTNNEHFSEQVLEQTLAAVRYEKRRRGQRRAGLAVCLLAVSLAMLLRPVSDEEVVIAVDQDVNSGPKNLVVFSTKSKCLPENRVTYFSTRDSGLELTYISTEEMSDMLGDIPHGFYKTGDGKTHFWSSALAQLQ
jgi:anti-sigma-K factor RskA